MTATELARLIAAIRIFRPDWPDQSLRTFLAPHAHRPLRDLAVAAIWITTDPATTTPGRLNEAGPWWSYARTADVPTAVNDCPTHPHSALWLDPRTGATQCSGCRNDQRADENARASFDRKPPPDEARQALAAMRAAPVDEPVHGDDPMRREGAR